MNQTVHEVAFFLLNRLTAQDNSRGGTNSSLFRGNKHFSWSHRKRMIHKIPHFSTSIIQIQRGNVGTSDQHNQQANYSARPFSISWLRVTVNKTGAADEVRRPHLLARTAVLSMCHPQLGGQERKSALCAFHRNSVSKMVTRIDCSYPNLSTFLSSL